MYLYTDLYAAHDSRGHATESARHLGHPLPHTLLDIVHVGCLHARDMLQYNNHIYPMIAHLEVGIVALALSHASCSPTASVSVEIHVGTDASAALEPDKEYCQLLLR